MAMRRIKRAFFAVMVVCLAGIIVTFLMLEPLNIESHCTTASEALLGSTNQRRRIVILNRAGYLGYNLSRGLAEQGDHVTMVGDADDSYLAAIVRRHRNDSERIPGGKFSHITGKLCDQGFLKHVFSLYIPTYVLISQVDECEEPGPNKDLVTRLSCTTNILEAARNFQGIRVVTLGIESASQDEDVISSGPVKESNTGTLRGTEIAAVAHAVREGQGIAFNIYRNVYDLTVTNVALKVLTRDKYGLCSHQGYNYDRHCGTVGADGETSEGSKDLSTEVDTKRDVVAEIVPKLSAILRIRHLCSNYRILVDFSGTRDRLVRGKVKFAQGNGNGYVRKNKIAILSKSGIKSLHDAPDNVASHIDVSRSTHIRETSRGCSYKSSDDALQGSEHVGERNTNKNDADNVREEVQNKRDPNGKAVNCADRKVNLVLSCQFVNFRNSRKKSSRFEITKMWYWGLKNNGLTAAVLHGGLRESYVRRVSDRNLTFHRVNMNEFTKSAKFFAFLDYLSAHPDVGRVILTDNSDVRFQRNPFELMDLLDDRLYVGTDVDIYPNIASMAWLTRRLEECFGHSFAQSKEFPTLTQMPYVYNAGVIGGPRHLVMQLLEKLTFVLDGVNPKAKNICNMAALNMVLHKYFADKVFTGFPWNSRYLRRQKKPKGVYVIHK
uniref:Uncharacterized protein n=1 Tax=Branchiostoma floridae TaxID=7739 RepID=C3ZFY7_BRAFL|eukprot:XP_002592451.1 hypothetical protein BRAFLDRAFT_68937 [Branchiostoma floridae]